MKKISNSVKMIHDAKLFEEKVNILTEWKQKLSIN
jgi:hypothetical protein